MIIQLLKKELAYVSHKVFQKGYVQATGGNLSVRVPGTDQVLIKRTAVSLGEVTSEDALLVNLDGEVIRGFGTPSKEINFHLGIYKLRPEVMSVVHCHPNYCIAYSNIDSCLPLVTVTANKILEHVPVVNVAPSSSSTLADNVMTIFSQHPTLKIALMQQHGVVSAGNSLEQAFNWVTLAEDSAKQAYLVEQIQANRRKSA